MQTNRRAFTLTELITAIAILSILAALTLAALGHIKGSAYVADATKMVGEIDKATQLYKNDFGVFPPANNNTVDETLDNYDTAIFYYLVGGKFSGSISISGKLWDDRRKKTMPAYLDYGADKFFDHDHDGDSDAVTPNRVYLKSPWWTGGDKDQIIYYRNHNDAVTSPTKTPSDTGLPFSIPSKFPNDENRYVFSLGPLGTSTSNDIERAIVNWK